MGTTMDDINENVKKFILDFFYDRKAQGFVGLPKLNLKERR